MHDTNALFEMKSQNNSKQAEFKNKKICSFRRNLSFTTTDSDVGDHFKKAGEVIDIRLAIDKNKASKGFAFVEFKDTISYEKAISLNHTFLQGRRINVEYTNKSSNKKQIRRKNLKLQAMRKKGKLQGSVIANQKRSVRRAKARQAKEKLVE